jgi:electron transfer flavoprotein alpha subunit
MTMANGVLILAEYLRGEVADITYEMLGAGRKLADALQAPLHVAVIGRGAGSVSSGLGLADAVFVVETPESEVPSAATIARLLGGLIEQKQEAIVLLGWTNLTMGVGSILSARSGLPFVNFCRSVRAEGGALVVTSQLFGGKILSDVRLADGRGIVGVSAGAHPADAGRSDRAPTVETVTLAAQAPVVDFKRFIEPEADDVDITKQDVLVAVGRGIQTRDNIELAEDLAATMGGAVCGSRPVVDQGWMALSRQVGKSGMSVKPRLYLALGISGAPEHVEGMQGSQTIIAVNTDAAAPIFDVAKYGVRMDVLELLPLLTEKIKARRG